MRIDLPPWEIERVKATTDADGRFALEGIPVGHVASLRVKSAGHGEMLPVRFGSARRSI